MGSDAMNSELLICRGKDCKKHRKPLRRIADEVSEMCSTGTIKCQDICKGPVLVLDHGEHRYWFKKMKGKDIRHSFRVWLAGEPMSPRLESRLVKRRRRR